MKCKSIKIVLREKIAKRDQLSDVKWRTFLDQSKKGTFKSIKGADLNEASAHSSEQTKYGI